MNVAQWEGKGATTTFSQPLFLIECIRSILKGLEMLPQMRCAGVDREDPLSPAPAMLLPRVLPLICLLGKLDPVASCTLVSLVVHTCVLCRANGHRLCMHMCACTHNTRHTHTCSTLTLLPGTTEPFLCT